MPSYLFLIATFAFTLLALLALRPIASKVGLMDHPGGRKDHATATPLIGGIAIYFGSFAVTLFVPGLLDHYGLLFAISTLILLTGIIDDYKDLSVSIRISTQILAAVLMFYVAGNQINSIGNLFFTGALSLGIMSLPFSIFAIVGLINAVNMSDGVDGLCGGMVLITLTFLGIVNYQHDNLVQTGFIAILVCALLAYLSLNFRPTWKRPALVYLGDAGSTFMGFVLAWLLIEGTQGDNAVMPPVLALWFMAVPLMDTLALLIKRPLEGKSPFTAGRDHLHHRLMESGFSTRRVVWLLYGLGIALGLSSLTAYNLGVGESTLFIAFVFLFAAYFYMIKYTTKTIDSDC